MASSDTESVTDSSQSGDIETELVTQVDEGVRIRSSITRGTGTRDEDDHTIEIERHSVEEALEDLDKALDAFESEYLQRIRNLNPQRERDDGDD
jgi:hypothetical protein